LATACSRPPGSLPGPPTLVPTPTYTATEAAFAANVNPLSGLPSGDPAIATTRPDTFAVTTEPGQDLPAGAQTTELVVEVLHPATPGFTLVTQERPGGRPALGPLSSLTARDVVVAVTLGAPLTAAAASPALAALAATAGVPLTTLSGGQAPTPLGPGHAPRWSFSELPDPAAAAASAMQVDNPAGAAVTWRYDPLLTTWHRWVAGRAAVDPATGEPLAVANVVVLVVPGTPGEPGWWTGSGSAWLLRDGTRLPARWVRAGATAPVGLMDARGMNLALRPGNTWWTVIPGPDAGGATPTAGP